MAKTASYFAILDPQKSPGVANKIEQTMDALRDLEFETKVIYTPTTATCRHFSFAWSLAANSSDLFIIRNTVYSMFLLMPVLLFKRMAGTRIVIDVPTPNLAALREMWVYRLSLMGKLIRTLFIYLNFPWALWPAHRILQYSDESSWFQLGVRKRTKLVANGISVDRVPPREVSPTWPADTFVLISVAALAPWQGIDRVLRGMALYRDQTPSDKAIKLRFIVVGEGSSRDECEALSQKLELEQKVEFVGQRTAQELTQLYNSAHVAISSLGMFRKQMNLASPLKAREYAARGIPFVHCGHDLDFDPVPNFLFKVPNNDEPIDLANLIDWFDQYSQNGPTADTLRQYAIEKLDYKNKVSDFIH